MSLPTFQPLSPQSTQHCSAQKNVLDSPNIVFAQKSAKVYSVAMAFTKLPTFLQHKVGQKDGWSLGCSEHLYIYCRHVKHKD